MGQSRELRFGISRNHGGVRLFEGATQLCDALAASLAIPVKLVVAFDYERLVDAVAAGAVELAWMPPLLQASAMARGARLVALSQRGGAASYRSALVVHERSAYRSVRDLRGARVAWVDRKSASGYLFPRLHLIRNGLSPERDFTESFLGSAALACAAVAGEKADLCACFVSEAAVDRKRAREEIKMAAGGPGERLRVLDLTDPIPPDGIVVSGGLVGGEQQRLVDALLALHRTKEGAAAMKILLQADRLVAVTEEMLAVVKRLA
jgi:phosphonate transport system substrate-binding protein